MKEALSSSSVLARATEVTSQMRTFFIATALKIKCFSVHA
jgi:hypothetical protein